MPRKKVVKKRMAKIRDVPGALSNAKMDPRVHGGHFGGEVLKAPLPMREQDQCSEAKDYEPLRVETAVERRLTSLEQALKSVTHIILHDYLYWLCESCRAANRTLRFTGQAGPWTCDSCGDQARDDYRKFILSRKP